MLPGGCGGAAGTLKALCFGEASFSESLTSESLTPLSLAPPPSIVALALGGLAAPPKPFPAAADEVSPELKASESDIRGGDGKALSLFTFVVRSVVVVGVLGVVAVGVLLAVLGRAGLFLAVPGGEAWCALAVRSLCRGNGADLVGAPVCCTSSCRSISRIFSRAFSFSLTMIRACARQLKSREEALRPATAVRGRICMCICLCMCILEVTACVARLADDIVGLCVPWCGVKVAARGWCAAAAPVKAGDKEARRWSNFSCRELAFRGASPGACGPGCRMTGIDRVEKSTLSTC